MLILTFRQVGKLQFRILKRDLKMLKYFSQVLICLRLFSNLSRISWEKGNLLVHITTQKRYYIKKTNNPI